MSKTRFKSIHVMPGLFCNYTCTHCVNESGPKMTTKVSSEEIQQIKSDIKDFCPPILQFSGGESSFYYEEINQIVESHPRLDECEVVLTSNGWYGKSLELTGLTLGKFKKISKIILSFDVFHGNEAKIDYLENIKNYAQEQNIELIISFCISSPIDLIRAKSVLQDIDLPVIYQRVDAAGRARINNLAYEFTVFEEEVLEQTCPNIDCASFIPDKGFSVCCGNLMFNGDNKNIYHDTLDLHIESPFYQELRGNNFREILERKGIDRNNLKAHHSTPCSLCEYIYCEAKA